MFEKLDMEIDLLKWRVFGYEFLLQFILFKLMFGIAWFPKNKDMFIEFGQFSLIVTKLIGEK